MKKTLLFAFAILFATAMMAQNRAMLLSESFDGSSIPAGWSVVGLGTSNWSISQTNYAGGALNELKMKDTPQFNGISRFVSPALDLTGVNSVVFSFKHALDNYQGSHTLSVATTSDGGTTWNVGWSQSYNTSSSWAVMQEITTPDMNHENVQFCLVFQGNSYTINNWYFDDIEIFTLENLDLGVAAVNIPEIIPNDVQTVSFSVMNYGITTVTNLEATYQIEGFEPVSESFNTQIGSLSIVDLSFETPVDLNPGIYNITITLGAVNGGDDDDAANNILSKEFSVAHAITQKYPMIEHFSSSTCGPCVSVNNQMNTFCNNNPGRFTYTKYQMNWPGNGDPYYTAEGGVRRTYYGVNAVPQLYLDGESTSVSQSIFNEHANRPAFMDIRGSFTVEGDVINVKADIMPYVTTEARVYISVNEKVTTGNVGTNGETSFHHVFMKMLPNGGGSSVAFTSTELQHFEFSQNLSSTHVEEMNDLEVSIWVQNYTTTYVYNSHFAYEYTDNHPYPVENLVVEQDPTADCICLTASWDAPTQGRPIGYNVYVNNELVAENITETSYFFQGELYEFYVVGVVALYANDQSSVKAVATVTESLHDLGLITETNNFMLDEVNPTAEVMVTNANDYSQSAINILSIEEVNDDDMQYLTISNEELPFALGYGESFTFTITPNVLEEGRSVAQTTIVLTSDAGELVFNVEIDGEVLSVTEISGEPKLYPNPASNNVRIEAKNAIESVMVYNMMGALVETISVNNNTANVNLSQYSNGVYFFNIRKSDGTVSNQRVVVSH